MQNLRRGVLVVILAFIGVCVVVVVLPVLTTRPNAVSRPNEVSRGTGHLRVADHGARDGQTTVTCVWSKRPIGYVDRVSVTGDFPVTVIVHIRDGRSVSIGGPVSQRADSFDVDIRGGGRAGSATFSSQYLSGRLTWSCEEEPFAPT